MPEIGMDEGDGVCLCLMRPVGREGMPEDSRALLCLCGPSNEDENVASTRSFSATTYKPLPITEEISWGS